MHPIPRLLSALAIFLSMGKTPEAQQVSDFQARSQRISATKSLPYRLFVPKGYQASKKYPLMLTLHGAGERGTDNAVQLTHHFNKRWAADSVQGAHPCFVVAPQCPPNNQWVDADWAKGSYDQSLYPITDEMQAVVAILDSLAREFSLDADRIYVSGLSMGGYGTWDIIARFPGRFAAAVPVCGGGDPRKAPVLAALPIWAFHAEDDNVVPVSGSRDMIDALKKAGGSPRYTEYPKALAIGHGSWAPAGNHPELTGWVFSKTRAASTALAPAARPQPDGVPIPRVGSAGRPAGIRFLPGPEAAGTPPVDGLGRAGIAE